ncbi:hypothetical protein DICA0_D15566 [Diutina catenulata]
MLTVRLNRGWRQRSESPPGDGPTNPDDGGDVYPQLPPISSGRLAQLDELSAWGLGYNTLKRVWCQLAMEYGLDAALVSEVMSPGSLARVARQSGLGPGSDDDCRYRLVNYVGAVVIEHGDGAHERLVQWVQACWSRQLAGWGDELYQKSYEVTESEYSSDSDVSVIAI